MEIKSSTIWDVLSILTLAATAGVLVLYGIIFFFPHVPLNIFPPAKAPEVVVLPSPTATLFQLPPTNTKPADLVATATIFSTATPTASITPTQPTATITLSPTITGTPPTKTPTPTATKTPTIPPNPVALTSAARTAIVQTSIAGATQTAAAKTAVVIKQTQDLLKTQNAGKTQTATFAVGTQTQAVIATQTAVAATATQAVIATATSVAATATQQVVNTQAAEATRTQQVVIEDNLPIAYSVTGGDDTAESFVTKKPSAGAGGPILYTLNIIADFVGARPISSWWMSDADNDYLLFADPTVLNPVHRVLYTTTVTTEQIMTGLSQFVLEPRVNKQTGQASSRTVVFTFAASGFGTDRDLWTVNGAGGNVLQISSDGTRDDHDPNWINAPTSSYNGNLLYVSGPTTGSENIYLMAGTVGSYPGTKLTFYDVATTEINSPRWCTGYDWATEQSYDLIVFAMRTSPSDDWDLYMIDPINQMSANNNDQVVAITNTSSVNETQPDWSEYCNRITYLSDSGGQWDVWIMNRDGSSPVKLTDTTEVEAGPLWMPNE